MDDGEMAPAAKRRTKTPYMSHELVSEILKRLPVESLVRFSCVCKAWRATISGDASFHRAHLRLQKLCLLVSPHTQDLYYLDIDEHLLPKDKIGLYRWEANQQSTTVPLVHATDLSSDDAMHDFVHCDGLVLLPADAAVHVLNPATHRILKLPWSRGANPPPRVPGLSPTSHQAFGLGHDPRSNAYKVARFFYRSVFARGMGGYQYQCHYTAGMETTGMEVFTIGTDQHWRETATRPPYPVVPRRSATFFKGSLIWTVDADPAPGFLRFSLENEAFGVLSPPPCHPRREYTMSGLAELRGELCVVCVGDDDKLVEMWMCDDVENPRWDRRYTVIVSTYMSPNLYPLAAFDDEIVFKEWAYHTRRYDLRTKAFDDVFRLDKLKYHNPSTGTLGYQRRLLSDFDVIPYVPSLVPLPKEGSLQSGTCNARVNSYTKPPYGQFW